MTPLQILTFARQRYNAVGDSFYSDLELLDALYDGCLELSLETECIEKRYSTTSVINQREYDKPTNAIRIARVTYDGKRLDPIDFVEDDLQTGNNSATTSVGTPKFYSQWEDTLFLRPTPSASGKTIEIFSIDEAERITSTTQAMTMPSRYHMKIVDYILYTMFAKDKNYNMSQAHLNKWLASVASAKRWEMKKNIGEKYPSVKPLEDMPFNDTEPY